MNSKKKNLINRRTFLALTGGTGAGIMFKQHEKYIHKLIPYVNAPHYPKPGEWSYYLTTCRDCPAGCGLMLWHRDGRVTKAEGNPEHPINKGTLCIRGQSSVWGEYDPDRIRFPAFRKDEDQFTETSWENAYTTLQAKLENAADVKVVSNLQTGSLAQVITGFASRFNQKPLFYEAFNYESLRRANIEMYGKDMIPRYNLSDCDLIIGFGVDFLGTWISPVEYARQFGQFHDARDHIPGRFIYVGAAQSLTALNSDEFIVADPANESVMAKGLLKRLGGNTDMEHDIRQLTDEMEKKLDELAQLVRNARNPVVLAGSPGNAPFDKDTVKAANRINEMYGRDHVDYEQYHALSFTATEQEIENFFQSVTENTILVVHNTNPVYSHTYLKDAFIRAGTVIYIGPHQNETSAMADWVLPSHFYLEDWGDYEAWNGTVSLLQPVMKPLYNTMSAGDIFLTLGKNNIEFRNLVRENWINWASELNQDKLTEPPGRENNFVVDLLQKGFLFKAKDPVPEYYPESKDFPVPELTMAEEFFYLLVSPSLFFYDGNLSNRGWLQEIPHPVSNLVWQSWVDIHAETAARLELEEGDLVRITRGDSEIKVPVRHSHQMNQNTISLNAGQGHYAFGRIANGIGENAFELITDRAAGQFPVVRVEKTGEQADLLDLNATKDQHHRELLQHVELETIINNTIKPEKVNWPLPAGYEKEKDLYDGHTHEGHRWGMVIDLQRCIGCKACEAACYAENNVPVVGKENCSEGREMSWLKVPPYRISENQTAFLPLPCQHCDAAPCEPVCPVYASVHTEEGLNAQIYNRCIGTRYCSNNCPYKVRRFNWINIDWNFPANLQLNPEVTVRSRGVMEKCTFCVQRIRNQEYQAKIENRPVRDGEIIPACVQTCPTQAFVFGDLIDEKSEIRRILDKDKRNYQLLNELNTKTAVFYLKKVVI